VGFVGWSRGACVERRASSVNNSTNFINEGSVVDVASISEVFQLSVIVEIPGIIGRVQLDLFGVEEQASYPFQIRVFNTVTDTVRAFAKVNVGEEGLSSFTSGAGTSEVV
jgi:hypothetical protein